MNRLLLLLCLFGANTIFAQQHYYVLPSATGQNTGLSWNDAFTNLTTAFQTAVSGDEIWVAAGTYRPTTSTDRTISFEPKSGVKMYGGFAGNETNLAQRDWTLNETVLSGDIGVPGDSTDNSYNVVYMKHPDLGTVMDGFTITRGNADAPAPNPDNIARNLSGGGVFVDGNLGVAFPMFRNITFLANYARTSGGGVCAVANLPNSKLSPQFISCSFLHNRTDYNGGAIFKAGGSNFDLKQDIDSCLFYGNYTAVYWRNYLGKDSLYVSNTTFSHNNGGPSISLLHNPAVPTVISVKNCNFELNVGGTPLSIAAQSSYFKGKVIVENCIFNKNRSFRNLFTIIVDYGSPQCEIVLNKISLLENEVLDAILHFECAGTIINADNIAIKNNKKIKVTSTDTQIFQSMFNISSGQFNFRNSKIESDNKAWQLFLLDCSDLVKFTNTVFAGNPLDIYDFGENYSGVYFQTGWQFQFVPNTFVIDGCVLDASNTSASISKNDLPYVEMRNSIVLHADTSSLHHFFPDTSNITLTNNYFAQLDTANLPPTFTASNNLIGIDPMLVNPAQHDYHLQPCSPLINAGIATGIQPGDTDLDGNPRILGSNVDIGPYETTTLVVPGPGTSTGTCAGGNNGAYQPEAVSCGPLTYAWTGPNGTTGTTLTDLAPGEYQLTVTDNFGSTAALVFTIPESPSPDLHFQTTPVFCGTTTGGSAMVIPDSGTPPFQYLWENSVMDSVRTNLPYGVYTVQLTDAAGCTTSKQVTIGRVGNLTINLLKNSPLCYGDANGSITVLPANGAPPYNYIWSDGSTGMGLSDLPAGAYYGTMTDALGCGINWIVPLIAPDSVVLGVPLINPATDTFAADGSINLQPMGGTAPFTAQWSNGETGLLLENLTPGIYAVTLTDINNCTTTAQYEVGYTVGSQVVTRLKAKIWPNPVSGFLHIQFPETGSYTITLSDITGRPMISQKIEGQLGILDVERLPSGTYLLQLLDKNGKYGWKTISVF